MNLKDIVAQLDLQIRSGAEFVDREVKGGYVSDMLSDVLQNASEGDLLVTLQIHLNVIAIASMKEIAAILIVNDRQPDQDTLDKAIAERIPVLGTPMNAYQAVGKLYELGLHV
jgi:hypothetical protein